MLQANLRQPFMLLGVVLVSSACGASQPQNNAAFCTSYEENYIGSCRQVCGAEIKAGDEDGAAKCEKTCMVDLSEDDTFNDRCPRRAAAIKK